MRIHRVFQVGVALAALSMVGCDNGSEFDDICEKGAEISEDCGLNYDSAEECVDDFESQSEACQTSAEAYINCLYDQKGDGAWCLLAVNECSEEFD